MSKKINRKKREIFYVVSNVKNFNEDVYIHLNLREGSIRTKYSAKYCNRGTSEVIRSEEGIVGCTYYSYGHSKVWYISVGNLGLHKIILRKGKYMVDIRIKDLTYKAYNLKLMKGFPNRFIIA